MTDGRLATLGRMLFAIGLLALAPLTATAAPDITGTVIVNEDDGFPGVCDEPCFSVQKLSEVYLAGNNTGPIACGAGQNLFVYTLTHLGGSVDPAPPINRFELAADDALVVSAGFVPGTGVAPSTTTISPLDVVSWEFMAPPIEQTESSEKLYICATGAVGAPGTTLVSIGGGPLDAPGECIGPVPGPACDIDIDKTCCLPAPKLPGDDDGDSDSNSSSDSDSASDHDANGDSDGASDSTSSSDSDSDSDRGNICDSKVTRLVVEVTGGSCSDTTNSQEGKASCSGPNPVLSPAIDMVTVTTTGYGASYVRINGVPGPLTVPVGSTLSFTHTSGQLAYATSFKVAGPGGTQYLSIVTSCDKGLGCSDQFGSVLLVELETTGAGLQSCTVDPTSTSCIAPPGPIGSHPGDNDGDSDSQAASDSDSASDFDANGDSDGASDSTASSDSDSDSDKCSKISEAVFKFTPLACQIPLPNPQGGAATCNGDASDATLPVSVLYTGYYANNVTVSPASGLQNGSTFRVTATGMATLPSTMKLQISDFNSVEQSLKLNVGGCEELSCGDEFGSLKLVGFTKAGGRKVDCSVAPPPPFQQACECPIGPPKPHCTGSLEGIRAVYLKDLFGSNCSVSNNQGGLASCSGQDLVDDNVSITILTDPSNIQASPNSGIDVKDTFVIKKVVNGYLQQLPSQVQFLAMDGSGNTQTVTIRTDCSKALDLGDRFGDFAVGCLDRGDGDNDNGGDDSDSDSDSDDDPALGTTGEDGLVCIGCDIEYQYKITNPNATGLVNVTVADDRFSPPPIATGVSLAPGEMKTFFLSQTLYDTTTNTATVTGELATGGECSVGIDDVTTTVTLPPQGAFDCAVATPLTQMTMKWNGTQTVSLKAWSRAVGTSTLLLTDTSVAPGDVLTVGGMGGWSDVTWEIFAAGGTVTKLGESKFDLTCYDAEMNGLEDCGKNEGNGRYNSSGLINTWQLDGLLGNKRLECTPGVVDTGTGGACGLGVELALLLPGLLWLRGRRRRAS